MTDNYLRMDYKRDTGTDADCTLAHEVDLDSDLTLAELGHTIDIDVDLNMNDIPYVVWLEEKLLKLLAK